MAIGPQDLIQASYFVAAALFIFGLKRMSSPKTARGGIVWAGIGMLVATLITFLSPEMHNYLLMTVAIAIGGIVAWVSGKRGAIAAVELFAGAAHGFTQLALGVLGGIIGAVSFAGSLIAFGKLQGLIKRSIRFRGQNYVNLAIVVATALVGAVIVLHGAGIDVAHGADRIPGHVVGLFVLALVL